MEKFCLIIDDNPQEDNIERLVSRGSERHMSVKCEHFNPRDRSYSDKVESRDVHGSEVVNFRINFEKVKYALVEKYKGQTIHLIACDYELGDKDLNGFDLLAFICEERKSSISLLYSGNQSKVVKDVAEKMSKLEDIKKEEYLLKLFKSQINAFQKRDDYVEKILELLKKEYIKTDLILEEKLQEYSDMVFKNTFPIFEGKKLGEIVVEIRKNTYSGNKFKTNLIELTIAHLIQLNE